MSSDQKEFLGNFFSDLPPGMGKIPPRFTPPLDGVAEDLVINTKLLNITETGREVDEKVGKLLGDPQFADKAAVFREALKTPIDPAVRIKQFENTTEETFAEMLRTQRASSGQLGSSIVSMLKVPAAEEAPKGPQLKR